LGRRLTGKTNLKRTCEKVENITSWSRYISQRAKARSGMALPWFIWGFLYFLSISHRQLQRLALLLNYSFVFPHRRNNEWKEGKGWEVGDLIITFHMRKSRAQQSIHGNVLSYQEETKIPLPF
jgi:hypothetical protein